MPICELLCDPVLAEHSPFIMIPNLLPRVIHPNIFEEPLVTSSTSPSVSSTSPASTPVVGVVVVPVVSPTIVVTILITSVPIILVPIVSATFAAILVTTTRFLGSLRELTKGVFWVNIHFITRSQRVVAKFR